MNRPLIILTGPTAVGKTRLSVMLAKRIGGEIISADSMQVYRHMDIGSAKIRSDEMEGVTHHLIDILEPTEDFNIVLFQKYAAEAIEEIYERGKIPIIAGGTGFYIQSVLYAIDFDQTSQDTEIRNELEMLAQKNGNEYVHDMLRKIDPVSAERIHANNLKRIIRAIEYYRLTGQRISEHNEIQRQKSPAYESAYFVLNDIRSRLYENIDQRVDLMINDGLVDEVRHLMDIGCKKSSTSMQGLGYKEIISYLENEITLDEAICMIKNNTHHYAKRQLTWFRRERDVIWVDKDRFEYDDEKMLAYIIENCPFLH